MIIIKFFWKHDEQSFFNWIYLVPYPTCHIRPKKNMSTGFMIFKKCCFEGSNSIDVMKVMTMLRP